MRKSISHFLTTALALTVVATASAAPLSKVTAKSANEQNSVTLTAGSIKTPKAQSLLMKTRAAKTQGNLKSVQPLTKATSSAGFKAKGEAPLNFPELRGAVCYSNATGFAPGVFDIPTTGDGEWNQLVATDAGQFGLAVIDGLFYGQGYQSTIFGTMITGGYIYDAETWEQTGSFDANALLQCIYCCAADAAGTYYAVLPDSEGNLFWGTIDWTTQTTNLLNETTFQYMALGFASDGTLYGLDNNGQFGTVDKQTGELTVINTMPDALKSNYICAGCMDPKTNRFFATSSPADETGWFLEINPQNGEVVYSCQYPNGEEVLGMYIVAPKAEDGAPAAVENMAVDFGEGAQQGTVTFKAPTTLFDGTAATGVVAWNVALNGEVAATGTCNYGDDVTANVVVNEAGNYAIAAYCSNAVGEGPKTKISMFIGKDAPSAVKNLKAVYDDAAQEFNVTWSPVTTGFNNGYINPDEVTYTVTYYPSEEVIAEGISATSVTVPQEEPAALTSYWFTVVAHYNGMNSAVASSNMVPLGNVVPPHTFTFNNATDLDGFTIIDMNGDGKTWTMTGGVMRVTYNASMDMDDWLITPGIVAEAGKMYKVTLMARSYNVSWGNEAIEAFWGTSPDLGDMYNELIPTTELPNTDFQPVSGMLIPDEDGKVYVGIHGCSGADHYYLELQSIEVAEGMDARVPAAAPAISAVAGENGELNATITITAPSKDMKGAAVEGPLEVELSCNGEFAGAQEDIEPGEEVEMIDMPAAAGYKTYSAKFKNQYGEGPEVSTTIFVGINKPAILNNVVMEEEGNTGKVTLTWDAADKDIDGVALDPANVTYTIIDSDKNVVVAGLDECEYTFQAVPEGEQDFVYYGVYGVTEGGDGEVAVSNMEPVGTPFPTPAEESFAEGGLNYPMGISTAGGSSISIFTDDSFSDMTSVDEDGGYMGSSCNTPGGYGLIFFPKFSLANLANPTFSFYTYVLGTDNLDTNEIEVSVLCDGETTTFPVVVVNTLGDTGWQKVKFSLADFADKDIRITIKATTQYYVYTFFDDFKIFAELDYNLAAGKIVAPAKVKQGEPFNVDVNVVNDGGQPAEEFSVELYKDRELVDTKTVDAPLAGGEKTVVTFEQTLLPTAPETTEYYAVVVYPADEEPNNNTTEKVNVAMKLSTLPAPRDLTGTQANGVNELAWTAPELTMSYGEVTETFEESEAFAAPEGWTVLDNDAAPVGGFNGITIPNWVTGSSPSVGQVIAWSGLTANSGEVPENLKGHNDSDKYFGIMFNYQAEQQDDWLISPELPGVAQTVSFYAKSYSVQYGGEEIRVLYSMGGMNPEDFVEALPGVQTLPEDWTEVAFDIPAGAKYFAVNCVSKDHFFLMMDDFTYVAGTDNSNLEVKNYNVYRDGKLIASPTTLNYTDSEVATSEVHSYCVTATFVDPEAESAISNIIALPEGSTAIEDIEAAGMQADVYGVNGVKLLNNANAAELRSLPAGVYIFGNKKVVVR